MRGLIQESHAGDTGSAAARVLNLVAVVDRDRREEIEKRLAQVGRYHPSRTIICSVEPGRTDARRARPWRACSTSRPERSACATSA